MTGGLIQLVASGSQDIFLTGSPQITYFKIVYRRHTNFAIESIHQYFINESNFGQESTSLIDKIGDLMSRVYLEIELPIVNVLKKKSHWKNEIKKIQNDFKQAQKYYRLVYNYTATITKIIRKLNSLLKVDNLDIKDIKNAIDNQENTKFVNFHKEKLQNYIDKNKYSKFKDNWLTLIQQIDHIDILTILNWLSNDNQRKALNKKHLSIKIRINKMVNNKMYRDIEDFYMKAYEDYLSKKNIYHSLIEGTYDERYKFAWVEEIGHAIIDYIEIRIGNQVIDKHTGDWLILYDKLFTQENQKINYNKMIGNVPDLFIFDDKIKQKYKLIVPFQFWFCRNTGNSLPLISLRYHDIIFTVKLKDLEKVCYFENDPNLLDINIKNIQTQYNINIINSKLYIDYIFLDAEEKKKFAQSNHEYLIEIVQYNETPCANGKQLYIHLNFSNPTKFIVWFVQPNHYRENPSGNNKCQWNNYGIHEDKSGYPIKYTCLNVNSYELTNLKMDIKFYNYLHPYLYFEHSPTDGLCVYSFAIKPKEHQPSSTMNLSRMDQFSVSLILSDEFIHVDSISTGIYFAAYSMSYNILRIINGMAGLAFST